MLTAKTNFQRDIMKSFAGAMRNTKICVFDGSIEHKAVRKFAQAMLSGCVRAPLPVFRAIRAV